MNHFNSSCGPESSAVMLSLMLTAKGPMPNCISLFLSMKGSPGDVSSVPGFVPLPSCPRTSLFQPNRFCRIC